MGALRGIGRLGQGRSGVDLAPGRSSHSGESDARRIGARAAGAMVDQVASSLTNYVVLFAALRSLSVSDLGIFTFTYTSCLLLITVIRGLVLEPLLIRYTLSRSDLRLDATARAAGASLVLGIAISTFALTAAPLTHGSVRSATIGFALSLPVLLIQDAWRHHLFSCKRVWAASVNDVTCLAFTMLATVAVLIRVRDPGVGILLLCWGAGTGVGALLGALQAQAVPRPSKGVHWLRENRNLGPALAGERSVESLAGQVSLALVGALVSTVALGELGASRAVMAPATTMIVSMAIFGVPEAARLRHSQRRLTVFAAFVSVATTAAVLGSTAILLLGPDWVGEFLAGKNWDSAKKLIIPVTIWTAAAGARRGPSVALRALERARALLMLSMITAGAVVPTTILGCVVAGAIGAAWAFAGTYVVSVAVYWIVFSHFNYSESDVSSPKTSSLVPRQSPSSL